MRIGKNELKKDVLCGMVIYILCAVPALSGCGLQETSAGKEETAARTQQEAGVDSDGQADDKAGDRDETVDAKSRSLGDFIMQDINGETYTQEIFGDCELTMVNVFTTWCTPCVREIPDLMKLHREMADQGVQVVGIVLDAAGQSGKTDQEAVEKAKILAEKTGAAYPFLIPDAGLLNGRLAGISAVPETFFVDKEGNIVGETYSGSRSFEDWKSIVEDLQGVKQ